MLLLLSAFLFFDYIGTELDLLEYGLGTLKCMLWQCPHTHTRTHARTPTHTLTHMQTHITSHSYNTYMYVTVSYTHVTLAKLCAKCIEKDQHILIEHSVK